MFSLGPLILLCAAALLWIRSDTTAWGHRARRILQAEPACGADARPNVLLVSLDTLRADSIGSYGGPIPTPNLDRVAAEGALFQVAVAPASETAPSHATLFTGRRVLAHGVRKNGISLPMEADTLAERFREAGWTTGAFVSSFVLDPRFGWGQGFAHFDAEFPRRLASFDVDTVWNPDAFWREHRVEGFDRPGVWTARAARDWFARAERPFFAFVHLFDAHEPHAPLRPLRRRVADLELDVSGRWLPGQSPREVEAWNRAYLSDVLAADEALGELLAPISSAALAPCTLLVVTGDHGQGLGQHGWLGHEISLYEEQLRVPLLFHWPGHVLPGRRIDVPVGLEDVAPTIVALAGLPSLTDTHGGSLQPLLRSGVAPPRGPLFARRRHYEQPMLGHRGHQNAIRTTAWKYIRSSHAPDELYYLARDPAELRNVLAQRPRVARRLGAELDAWLAAAPVSQSEETEPLPADVRRGLEALGYVD